MQKLIVFTLSIIAFITVTQTPVNAETMRLDVIEDAFIRENTPDTNYGDSTSLLVCSHPTKCYSFIKFRDFVLPEGATFQSASLHFYIYNNQYRDNTWIRVGANSLIGGWDEEEIQWSGPYPGMYMVLGSFVEENLDITEGWKELDITNVVQVWLDGERENEGVYFYFDDDAEDFLFSMRSKEYGASTAPYIQIEYIPEIIMEPFEVDEEEPEVVEEPTEEVETTTDETTTVEEAEEQNDAEDPSGFELRDIIIIVACSVNIILFLIILSILLYLYLRRKKGNGKK